MKQPKTMQIVSHGKATRFPLYIRAVNNQPPTDLHGHEFVELVLIISGHGTHSFGSDEHHHLSRGDVFIVPRGQIHGYIATEELNLVNVLYIPENLPMPPLDAAALPGFDFFYKGSFGDDQRPLRMHISESEFLIIENYLTDMHEEIHAKKVGFQFNSLGLFMVLLGKLLRIHAFSVADDRPRNDGINNVIAYLHRNLRKKITIEQLCRIAGMSRSSLMRKFTGIAGTAPLHYQMQLRIAEAMQLLQMTDKPLGEIAFELGFTDSNYFGRQFKKITGISPLKFRNRKCQINGTSCDIYYKKRNSQYDQYD